MDELLAVRLSSLEHFMYCPRQCALIDVEGQWIDNRHTTRGQRVHRRADSGEWRTERGRVAVRSLPLWSSNLGLQGRADVVEFALDGSAPVPVEYKAGTRHGLTADVQLCAQALCLEEMFECSVDYGLLWFSAHRRRVQVELDDGLRSITLDAISQVRAMIELGSSPPPANDRRCDECQLLPRCLPSVTAQPERALALAAAIEREE